MQMDEKDIAAITALAERLEERIGDFVGLDEDSGVQIIALIRVVARKCADEAHRSYTAENFDLNAFVENYVKMLRADIMLQYDDLPKAAGVPFLLS